jgi:hypothetical protein
MCSQAIQEAAMYVWARNKSTASSVREAVRVVILLCDPIRNGSYYYALISN